MNEHTKHEADIVSNMIEIAEKHNLLTEVVLSYGYACRNHRPLELEEYEDCAQEALNEWIK